LTPGIFLGLLNDLRLAFDIYRCNSFVGLLIFGDLLKPWTYWYYGEGDSACPSIVLYSLVMSGGDHIPSKSLFLNIFPEFFLGDGDG
jgi:hypothetical protein